MSDRLSRRGYVAWPLPGTGGSSCSSCRLLLGCALEKLLTLAQATVAAWTIPKGTIGRQGPRMMTSGSSLHRHRSSISPPPKRMWRRQAARAPPHFGRLSCRTCRPRSRRTPRTLGSLASSSTNGSGRKGSCTALSGRGRPPAPRRRIALLPSLLERRLWLRPSSWGTCLEHTSPWEAKGLGTMSTRPRTYVEHPRALRLALAPRPPRSTFIRPSELRTPATLTRQRGPEGGRPGALGLPTAVAAAGGTERLGSMLSRWKACPEHRPGGQMVEGQGHLGH